ncbi:DEAD/DEAH box helicase [Romboutsia lituseburensis]|uniref:DEAD/DEAH box helicase n=1 Tax=Romboutsia lituseburensis TaxID=1537 RepID=UPI0022EA2091|nr:DEAD/DEAH box helicase [Romboutsia lituseburensis]
MNKKLNLNYVSEIIGEDYKSWNKGDYILIQSQTGTGKTFAILGSKNSEGFIDKIDNKTLLYLCNRSELKSQILIDLIKKFDEYNLIKKDNDTNKENIFELDNIECDINKLNSLKTVRNITVETYQSVSTKILNYDYLKNEKYDEMRNFDYIVCDECHYYLTDSSFNNSIDVVFTELIRNRYANTIKIFMSATIDEIEDAIVAGLEYNNKLYNVDNKLHKISTGIDYSYLHTNYFVNEKDIVTTIKNDKTDNKWLIFVKSKKEGNFIKEELQALNIDTEFIMSSTPKNNKEKRNIREKSKFDCRVLVSTKCLDNGVNIKDDSVKNLVVLSYDKTTFIQEVGRLRLDINNAREINLYIPTFNKRIFKGLINKYDKKIEQTKEYETDLSENKIQFKRKYDRKLNYLYNDLFFTDKEGKYEINTLGYSRLYKDKNFAEKMIMKFEGGIEMEDGTIEKFDCDYKDKFAYVKEQLKWLGLEEAFSEDNLIEMVADDVIVDNLKNFLEDAYENNERFTKDFFLNKMNEFLEDDNIRLAINKIDNGKSRSKGMKLYNKLFEVLELDFVVGSNRFKENGKLVTKWIVVSNK